MNESKDPLERLLHKARQAVKADGTESMPPGFAGRVLAHRRATNDAPDAERLWLAGRRMTTWLAGIMASVALVTRLTLTAPAAGHEIPSDDPADWEQQIEAWIFEP